MTRVLITAAAITTKQEGRTSGEEMAQNVKADFAERCLIFRELVSAAFPIFGLTLIISAFFNPFALRFAIIGSVFLIIGLAAGWPAWKSAPIHHRAITILGLSLLSAGSSWILYQIVNRQWSLTILIGRCVVAAYMIVLYRRYETKIKARFGRRFGGS